MNTRIITNAKKHLADTCNQEPYINSKDKDFLNKAKEVILNNIQNDTLTSKQFCTGLNMSRTAMHQKLKSLTGMYTTKFIRSIRLQKAMSLLREGSHNVCEVAYLSGFNNLSYFTRCFKAQFDDVPSKFSGIQHF